jgi:hypothetical protein
MQNWGKFSLAVCHPGGVAGLIEREFKHLKRARSIVSEMVAMMSAIAALGALLAGAPHADDGPPGALRLWVDPEAGSDSPAAGLAPGGGALKTLGATQRRLRRALREEPGRDVIIGLTPGTHRVPPGGLIVTAEDSPPAGTTVIWQGDSGGGGAGRQVRKTLNWPRIWANFSLF